MEAGINALIKEQLNVGDVDIRTYSPLALAYIGDAIFDLVIRTVTIDAGNTSVNKMHKKTADIVNARTQAKIFEAIKGKLSEEELDIARRGRNTKMNTTAKNASLSDYRKATGLEAVMGYLYLKDETERLFEIIKMGLESIK